MNLKKLRWDDILSVEYLRKGVNAVMHMTAPNIIIILATCCIWVRAPGAEEITAMLAGRWPLDWYYRCNIVNNIPLS